MLIQAIPLHESPAKPDVIRQDEIPNDGLIVGDSGTVRTYGCIGTSAAAEEWPPVDVEAP